MTEAQIVTAIDSLTTAYLAAAASPRPNYSIEGQSVSFPEYMTNLRSEILELTKLRASLYPTLTISQGI